MSFKFKFSRVFTTDSVLQRALNDGRYNHERRSVELPFITATLTTEEQLGESVEVAVNTAAAVMRAIPKLDATFPQGVASKLCESFSSIRFDSYVYSVPLSFYNKVFDQCRYAVGDREASSHQVLPPPVPSGEVLHHRSPAGLPHRRLRGTLEEAARDASFRRQHGRDTVHRGTSLLRFRTSWRMQRDQQLSPSRRWIHSGHRQDFAGSMRNYGIRILHEE